MESVAKLHRIEEHICLKSTIKGAWQKSTPEKVLSFKILETKPLIGEDKKQLPVFGFNKAIGNNANKQLFPTCFLILELDTPNGWKEMINDGCEKTYLAAKSLYWLWFVQFKFDVNLPFYWMYLTPSTRGLRFVLHTDKPVINENHYKQVVKAFLRVLYKRTNGQVNPDYFDILVNQAWIVPTFEDFFYAKEETFTIEQYVEPLKETKSIFKPSTSYKVVVQPEGERFQLAIQFTERNFTFIKGERNKFIFNLACNCNRFDLPQSSVLDWIIARYDLSKKEIRGTVYSAYRSNRFENGFFLKQK